MNEDKTAADFARELLDLVTKMVAKLGLERANKILRQTAQLFKV